MIHLRSKVVEAVILLFELLLEQRNLAMMLVTRRLLGVAATGGEERDASNQREHDRAAMIAHAVRPKGWGGREGGHLLGVMSIHCLGTSWSRSAERARDSVTTCQKLPQPGVLHGLRPVLASIHLAL